MATDHPIILFDGVCNFCNASINLIIRQDKKKIFRFAALQSKTGQELTAKHHLPQKDFGSFVLIQNNKVYTKSTAAFEVWKQLPWYWQWLQVLRIIPRNVTDGVYDIIARNRYKWFGEKESCMIPTPDVRNRFLE